MEVIYHRAKDYLSKFSRMEAFALILMFPLSTIGFIALATYFLNLKRKGGE